MRIIILIVIIIIANKVNGQSCDDITINYDKFTEVKSYVSTSFDIKLPSLKDTKSLQISVDKKILGLTCCAV
ncbi:MAG: hypothetical protein HQ541_14205 [Mariniphaga sp.]|nr:hypothetical protein [Mariniphaga sp.]